MFINYGTSNLLISLKFTFHQGIFLVFATILGILTTILLLVFNYGLISIASGWFIRSMVYFILIVIFIFKNNILTLQKQSYNIKMIKELLSTSGIYSISKIARTVVSRSDGLIVSNIVGLEATTTYILSIKILQTISTFLDRIGTALMPFIANYFGGEEIGRVKKYSSILLDVLIRLSLLSIILITLFSEEIISAWVGEKYYAGELFSILTAVYFFIYIIYTYHQQIVFAVNEIKPIAFANIIETILKIVLAIVMCRVWGLIGLMMGTIISITIPFKYLLKIKKVGYDNYLSNKPNSIKIFITINISLFILLFYLNNLIDNSNFGIIMAKIFISIVILFSINYLIDRNYYHKLKKLI